MRTPQRSNCPPEKPGVYWVERVKGNGRGTFRIYSPAFWGFDTHYTNGRTCFCYENQEHCDGGHNQATLRWNGYLFAWDYQNNRKCFVHFTDRAARMVFAQLATGASLRGCQLEVFKTKADKGRLNARINEWMPARDWRCLRTKIRCSPCITSSACRPPILSFPGGWSARLSSFANPAKSLECLKAPRCALCLKAGLGALRWKSEALR